MFKRAQENTDHLRRVGSASTRPSARGTFRDIPSWAKEAEEYFNSVMDSYNIANRQLYDLRARMAWLKLRMKDGRASPGEILEAQENVRPLIENFEKELDHLRNIAVKTATRSWSVVFMGVARGIIDERTYRMIQNKVAEILQREKIPPLGREKPTKRDIKRSRHAHWPPDPDKSNS